MTAPLDDITFSVRHVTRRTLERAQLLIDHHQLHATPWQPVDVYPLLHLFDLRFVPLNPHLKGVTLDTGTKIIIAINDALPADESRFVAMHEVGHVALWHPSALHQCSTQPMRNRVRETEANTFAAMVLLPRAAVFDVGPDCIDLPEVAAFYSVPPALLRIRVALFELFHV